MKEVDIDTMSVTELKALAYDLSLDGQRISQNLAVLNSKIQEKLEEPKKENEQT